MHYQPRGYIYIYIYIYIHIHLICKLIFIAHVSINLQGPVRSIVEKKFFPTPIFKKLFLIEHNAYIKIVHIQLP